MFALEEHWARQVGELKQPVIHLWRHPRAMVLGLRDRRLQAAAQTMERLREEGLSVWVRNSGGAAVPLHAGVLNVTLIMPKAEGRLDYHEDFRMMVEWIRELCRYFGLEAHEGEVAGGYCPGDYDLAVRNRKFCGIAQRRQLRSIAVQAFINVEGIGETHAGVAKRFYDQAKGAVNTPEAGIPIVLPEQTCFLSEMEPRCTMSAVLQYIQEWLGSCGMKQGGTAWLIDEPTVLETTEQLRQRYDR